MSYVERGKEQSRLILEFCWKKPRKIRFGYLPWRPRFTFGNIDLPISYHNWQNYLWHLEPQVDEMRTPSRKGPTISTNIIHSNVLYVIWNNNTFKILWATGCSPECPLVSSTKYFKSLKHCGNYIYNCFTIIDNFFMVKGRAAEATDAPQP